MEEGTVSPHMLKACKLTYYFDYVGIYLNDASAIMFRDQNLTDEEKQIILFVGQ
jgi:hypothetical protein